MNTPLILAVSDSTGETALQMSRAGLAQFGPYEESSLHLVPNVRTEEALAAVVKQAAELGAMVVYTLVGPELRAHMKMLLDAHDVRSVDLIGPLIARMSRHLERRPLYVPGLGHELDEDYFRRVEAVEFAVKNDDGRHPGNLHKADIVLVGVSRTSKTPLSNYIAHRGYRVANVPIVLGVPLPNELDDVDPERVFGLSIEPSVLMKIRRERMEALRMNPDSDYGDIRHIRREAAWSRKIFRAHPEWTVINITRKAVEETASMIIETYRERFPSSRLSTSTGPAKGKKDKTKRSKPKSKKADKGKKDKKKGDSKRATRRSKQ